MNFAPVRREAMPAMSVHAPVLPGPPGPFMDVSPSDDEDELIESAAVRLSVEEAFLRCTGPLGNNGYLHISELIGFLKSSGRTVLWNAAKLSPILGRCERLTLTTKGLVIWTGAPEKSFLLRRLCTIVAARKSKLSLVSTLVQLQRGTDRLSVLTAEDLADIAIAVPEFTLSGAAIDRSETFHAQAVDVLEGDEYRIFRVLQRTQFALTAHDIRHKLGRRAPLLETVQAILDESPVITQFDGGYRSVIETPTQLGLKL
jgi:hypothetical protein